MNGEFGSSYGGQFCLLWDNKFLMPSAGVRLDRYSKIGRVVGSHWAINDWIWTCFLALDWMIYVSNQWCFTYNCLFVQSFFSDKPWGCGKTWISLKKGTPTIPWFIFIFHVKIIDVSFKDIPCFSLLDESYNISYIDSHGFDSQETATYSHDMCESYPHDLSQWYIPFIYPPDTSHWY